MFPERWLPAAIAVLPGVHRAEALVNSTMKMRGKVEKRWADRIAYAYTPRARTLNPMNLRVSSVGCRKIRKKIVN